MTEKSYESEFRKSLDALEDIQLLSEFSLSPLISNAYFYLSEMKRKADLEAEKKPEEFKVLNAIFEEKLDSIMNEFFSNPSKYKTYNYESKTEQIDLIKWNKIFSVLPEIFSVVSLFSFHGQLTVSLNQDGFIVKGVILEDLNFEMNRKFIYVVTRKLLREKVLLTYSSVPSDRAGLFRLVLKADFSHTEKLQYLIPFKSDCTNEILLGISNVFSKYRASLDDLTMSGDHHIIEIKNDFTIQHSQGLPELSCTESVNKEILHLPFIFRPISIILPMKGTLFTESQFKCLDDKTKRKQDVSKSYHTIDFFSLFSHS